MSGVRQHKEVVVRSAEEWATFSNSLPVRRPPPNVAFENTMLAAVFLGDRPTAGYSVEITGAVLEGDTLVVGYVERPPAPDTAPVKMVTTPYVVAGVPRHDGPVRFVKVDPGAAPRQ